MQLDDIRPARVIAARHRIELAKLADDVLPRAGNAAETVGYFCVLCAFWGLIIFVALTGALQ